MTEEINSIFVIFIQKIPSKKWFQEDFYKELSFSFLSKDIEEVCRKNSKACEKYKLTELSELWLSFLPGLRLINSPEHWLAHPLGLNFLIKFLKYFWRIKNYMAQAFTSAFILMCLQSINISPEMASSLESQISGVKDIILLVLKEFSEDLHRLNAFINSRAVMKLAGEFRSPQLFLSSEKNLGFDKTHNYTAHGKNYCTSCSKRILMCSICSKIVNSLGIFCKSCGHGGHLTQMLKWFHRENMCPSGCGCNCLVKLQVGPDSYFK